jgi:PleD family two-component response regulator
MSPLERCLKQSNTSLINSPNSNQKLRQLNLSLEQRVESRTQDLMKVNQSLKYMALHDQLTDLPNRRSAMLQLEGIWNAWL